MTDKQIIPEIIPGEYRLHNEDVEINAGRKTIVLDVTNHGDRPVQVGSHFHFFEVNKQLRFHRQKAMGMRLNIPSGNAVRFEPGEMKQVSLVVLGGHKKIYGHHGLLNQHLDKASDEDKQKICQQAKTKGFLFCDDEAEK